MAQLVVRNLEDDVKERIRAQARKHGRSMEEEVREILRAAVPFGRGKAEEDIPLGTWIVKQFEGIGVDLDPYIEQIRGASAKPAKFDD